MRARVKRDGRADEGTCADPDGAGVERGKVEVYKHVFREVEVVAVVDVERGLNPGVVGRGGSDGRFILDAVARGS